jgi:uncharacterized protein involved in cysteine biosynthesis
MMSTLFTCIFRAITSAFAPGMFGIFVWSIVITIGALMGFVLCAGWLTALLSESLTAGMLGSFGAIMIAWFLFPGIMPVIVNFFDQRIVGLIEAHHYRTLPPAMEPPFWPELRHDALFSLSAITLNILALPLYMFPPLFPVVFYGLNGYLLGREFFTTVAKRRWTLDAIGALRRRHRGIIWVGGIVLTVLATLPILNLFAPFFGIALMTHLYHALAAAPRDYLDGR